MESIKFRWNVFRQVTVVFVTVSFSGCSIFAPSMQTIQVSSSPDRATVVAEGKPVGETPVQFDAHRGKDLLIEVKKPGYQSQFRTTSRTLSSIGTVDVIGAYFILLPLLGLLSSGAWKHDPESYGFVLEPEK
ncbi:MAG: PEGA domain-containing protein [Nitrospira sp.]|nr:PEGA domain-containing protein [Nitrospira sp.]